MRFIPLGDSAVTAKNVNATAIVHQIRKLAPAGILDVSAAFDAVTVVYDAAKLPQSDEAPYETVCRIISEAQRAAPSVAAAAPDRPLQIPVRYGGDDGPDLANLAKNTNLSEREFIAMHSSAKYVVLAVGFMPGFGYLGGLPERLHAPRLDTPRTRIPAGSVAIGANYTGIYPFESPGGWNIIGRTSLRLFNPSQPSPAKLHVGQTVRFVPVAS
jgi:inhibitor of KinA